MSASWWLSSRSVFSPRLFQGLLFFRGKFATQLFFVSDLVLQRVGVAFQLVSGVDALLELFVFFSELLGIVDHPFDLLGGQAILVIGNCNLILVPCTLVFSCHTQNTVHVDLEGNFDLRHATGSRRNSSQIECAQEVIVFG